MTRTSTGHFVIGALVAVATLLVGCSSDDGGDSGAPAGQSSTTSDGGGSLAANPFGGVQASDVCAVWETAMNTHVPPESSLDQWGGFATAEAPAPTIAQCSSVEGGVYAHMFLATSDPALNVSFEPCDPPSGSEQLFAAMDAEGDLTYYCSTHGTNVTVGVGSAAAGWWASVDVQPTDVPGGWYDVNGAAFLATDGWAALSDTLLAAS